jgi:REP element-mobilizing transposase RayT
MPKTLATMITITTYGTWLRGDQRGWVDDGKTMPPSPPLEWSDRRTMKHPPYTFPADKFELIGELIGESLRNRIDTAILAMTIQSWHIHMVIGPTRHPIADVVKCAKDAVRYGLRIGRPIWTAGYDKRFCFDAPALRGRIEYVERHNLESGLPAKPWNFIVETANP